MALAKDVLVRVFEFRLGQVLRLDRSLAAANFKRATEGSFLAAARDNGHVAFGQNRPGAIDNLGDA